VITQIRLSVLNNQLFICNLIDNPFCRMCGNEVKTPQHFFLLCHVFKEQRTILLSTINDINNSITETYCVKINCNISCVLLNSFLQGYNVPQLVTKINNNMQIFNAVSRYIIDSRRLFNIQQ